MKAVKSNVGGLALAPDPPRNGSQDQEEKV